jgi:hypothetical protein
MTQYTVKDGLFRVVFTGTLLGHSDTHRNGVLRWVEMDLYWAEPGQEETSPLLRMPEGGYVTHIIGQSVVAHRLNSGTCSGLPVKIADMIPDALPCPDCEPDPFPLMRIIDPGEYRTDEEREELLDIEAERIMTLRRKYDGMMDVESPRHTLRRAATAREAVRRIVGPKLSWPAEKLLHVAAQNDPLIKAAMEDPSTAA